MARRSGPALLLLLLAATPAAAQRRERLSDRGLDSLRLATTIDSVDAESWYRYGLGLWEHRRFDAADSAFQRALRFQPWHGGAHLALSFLPFGRGDRYLFDLEGRVGRDSALAILRTAVAHRAAARLGEVRLDLSALRFLRDDELVPDSREIRIGGVTFRSWFVIPGLQAMRKAMRQLIDDRPDSAFTLLTQALARRRPDEGMTNGFIELYADAAYRSGRYEAAAQGYRELAQRATRREQSQGREHFAGPVNERALYLLLYGLAVAETGQHAVARAALREALVADLTLYQAHARLAELAESDGDVEGAIAERQSAVALAPENARAYLDLGITLLQAGRPRPAVQALTEAVARVPWDPGSQLFLFEAALAAQDRATAERALASLELFAPRRNREQVDDARRRLAELP